MIEKLTLDLINALSISEEERSLLIEAIEWEKEVAWSEGWAAHEEDGELVSWYQRHPSVMKNGSID